MDKNSALLKSSAGQIDKAYRKWRGVVSNRSFFTLGNRGPPPSVKIQNNNMRDDGRVAEKNGTELLQ